MLRGNALQGLLARLAGAAPEEVAAGSCKGLVGGVFGWVLVLGGLQTQLELLDSPCKAIFRLRQALVFAVQACEGRLCLAIAAGLKNSIRKLSN